MTTDNKQKIPTNKLTVYLLKDGIRTSSDALQNGIDPIDFGVNGKLYIDPSQAKTPDWLHKFFDLRNDQLSNLRVFSAAARAVLLVEGVKGRIFAVTFGYGKHMLKPSAIEQRFGLKTTLNIIDQDDIRSVDVTSLESVPKHSRSQISQDGDIASFGLNIEQDLVRAITGKARFDMLKFGRLVSGKDALYLTVKKNISQLKDLLGECYERYLSDDYKANFDWVDQIKEVEDRNTRETLNANIIAKINDNDRQKLWVATPEQIEWSETKGFALQRYDEEDELDEDVSLSSIIEAVGEGNVSLDRLKQCKVLAISNETNQVKHTWKAYDCLYAEIEEGESTYLLTNGKWYEIERDFVKSVNKAFKAIPKASLDLPDYTDQHANEAAYNAALAPMLDGVCFDADNISYGGGHSKIEFCDVYSGNKDIIHIKHYSGSSTLSHHFSQGSVAGELYKNDQDFRTIVNNKLPANLRLKNPGELYRPDGQKIIFGIITRNADNLDLPFFSKVNLRNTNRLLTGFDYGVEIAAIKNTTPKKVKKK